MLRTAGGLTVNQTVQFGGYYGAFYSSQTQSDGVNTPHAFWCENTFTNNGVSMVTDGTHNTRIKFTNAGAYNIQFSTVFFYSGGGGTGKNINVWFKLNGANIPNSNTLLTMQSSSPYLVAAWNFIQTVAANDYVEIFWETDNANNGATPIAATGDMPATPSVIITATQVA